MSRLESPALPGNVPRPTCGSVEPDHETPAPIAGALALGPRFAVIEWTGRRSGRRFSTPVAYLLRGDEAWVTTGDAWWRNLHSDPSMRVWLSGTRVEGDAAPVTDPEESVHSTSRCSRSGHSSPGWLGCPRDRAGPRSPRRWRRAASSFGPGCATEHQGPNTARPTATSRPAAAAPDRSAKGDTADSGRA